MFLKHHKRVTIYPIFSLLLSVVILGVVLFLFPNIIGTVALIILFTLLLILATLVILAETNKLYTLEISAYFIVHKYPWSKYYFIGQQKNKNTTKSSCKEILREFSKSETDLIGKLQPNRVYLASTHSTLIRRLKANPKVHLVEYNDVVKKPLSENLKNLVQRDCETCEEKQTCFSYKNAQKEHEFRTIWFEIIVQNPLTEAFCKGVLFRRDEMKKMWRKFKKWANDGELWPIYTNNGQRLLIFILELLLCLLVIPAALVVRHIYYFFNR